MRAFVLVILIGSCKHFLNVNEIFISGLFLTVI